MDLTSGIITLTLACSDEKRLEPRFLCADLVRLSWTEDDVVHEDGGNLEDLSPSGCRLLMDHAIPETTPVEFQCGQSAFRGTVRYCRSGEIGFDLGIEFNQPGIWKQEEFEAQHLLDVRTLFSEPSAE
jgi:hypothetical protein